MDKEIKGEAIFDTNTSAYDCSSENIPVYYLILLDMSVTLVLLVGWHAG